MSYFHLTKIVTQGHTKISFFFTDSSKIEILLEVVRMSMLDHVMLGAAWLLVGQALLDWRSGVH